MKENLSKCPFCGGENVVMMEVEHHDERLETFLGCCSCGAKGPSSFHGEEKAVEAWNTRAYAVPKHRPAEVLTGKDRRNIGDALFNGDIHIEHVLPLHAAHGGRIFSVGWEALAERLEEMDEDQLKEIFDDLGIALIAEAQECADRES